MRVTRNRFLRSLIRNVSVADGLLRGGAQDYVRNQTVIEAKLDGLRDKLEVVQMKEANQ